MSFETVEIFEEKMSSFFGSKFAVSTDSCTHAIELCLRINPPSKKIYFPKHTYIGIPMIAIKLNLEWDWNDQEWSDYYFIEGTSIIDAAVLWKKNSYIDNTLMCISFQYQKHINIGRGGIILTNNYDLYKKLILMSYDGRLRNVPWRNQNIETMGYHYYLTPESAKKGIEIFNQKKDLVPKKWTFKDYPDLSKMEVFNKK